VVIFLYGFYDCVEFCILLVPVFVWDVEVCKCLCVCVDECSYADGGIHKKGIVVCVRWCPGQVFGCPGCECGDCCKDGVSGGFVVEFFVFVFGDVVVDSE